MRGVRETALDFAMVVVLACTVTMTFVTLRDRFGASGTVATPGRQPPAQIQSWDSIARIGHRIGPDSAPVTVVVFSDFECPMCGVFATETYPTFRDRYPGQTALVYRHWPLTRHRFSYPAAHAAECAAEQGSFFDFHDAIYAEQRLLGLKTFLDSAAEAGVDDLNAFQTCAERTESLPGIELDVQAVRELGGQGTPTVIVNGWLLVGGVDLALLDSIAKPYLDARETGAGR